MHDGCEVRTTPGKGRGVFASKKFRALDIVMVGTIEELSDTNHSHASQIGEGRYAFHAGLIPMVNHSCDPNCGISVNEGGGHDFVAMKEIGVGEEVCFDYDMRNYSIDHFPHLCVCGSVLCRGSITGWKNLDAQTRQKYFGFVPPYILEMDAAEEASFRTVSDAARSHVAAALRASEGER